MTVYEPPTESPDIDVWVWFDLNLVNRSDGTALNLVCSNRPFLEITYTEAWQEHFALIKGMKGIGSAMGNFIPRAIIGSIELDISHNSFGYERRVCDIFERYTPIEQDIDIFVHGASLKSITDPEATGTATFKSKVKSWRCDFQSDTLTLTIESQTLERRVLSKVITKDEFPNAPSGAVGKHLPIVLGEDVQVRAYPVVPKTNAFPEWAYATALHNEHPVGGTQKYFVRNHHGDHVEVDSASSASTAVISHAGSIDGVQTSMEIENCYEIDKTGASNTMITGGRIKLRGTSPATGTVSGELVVKIYEGGLSSYVSQNHVAESIIDKSDYETDWKSSNDFYVDFSFDRAIALSDEFNSSGGHFISVSATNEISADVSETQLVYVTGAPWFSRVATANDNVDIWQSQGSRRPHYDLYGVEFIDTAIYLDTKTGLATRSFTGNLNTPGTSQINPAISGLDIIVEIDGLQDDSSGTITGTPSAQITRPDHAIELLSQQWSGSAWTSPQISNVDFATNTDDAFSTGDRVRTIAGRSTGRVTFSSIVDDICRNHGARIVLRDDGLHIYAEGTAIAPARRIEGSDVKIVSLEELPAEKTVLNSIDILYSNKLVEVKVESGTAEGRFQQYEGYDFFNSATSGELLSIIGESENNFGQRFLDKTTFDWIGDSTTASSMANILLKKWAQPIWMARIELPYFRYQNIDLLDTIEIISADLPAYFGTSYDARPETYNSNEVNKGGIHEMRAQKYKAQVESRRINWTPETAPVLQLEVRIITNEAEVL